MTLSKPN